MTAPTLTQPPAALQQAIDQAARLYGVPADVLAGIWRVESGSTYPNPAVNSSGYGGLFGTHNWNGSTQSQADTAASTLANLIREAGGNISTALGRYSGGGYTQVPGQTSFGNVTVTPGATVSHPFATVLGGGVNVPAAPPPSTGSSGGGFWGDLGSGVSQGLNFLGVSQAIDAAGHAGSTLGKAFEQAASDTAHPFVAVGDAIGGLVGTVSRFLSNLPSYLVRGGLIVGGGLLLLLGLALAGRSQLPVGAAV